MNKILAILFLIILLLGCNKKVTIPQEKAISKVISKQSHAASISQARTQREANLTRPTGWLSLIGIYWLDEGMNSIGGAEDNTIVFPRTTTETIGAYQKQGDDIFFGKVEEVEVLYKGEPYLGGPVDIGYPYTEVNHGSLYWHIIKRGDRYGVGLKDTLADNRMQFEGIPYFPVDGKYSFNAEVTPTEDSLTIINVLGVRSRVAIAAYLNFNVAEHYYSLAALDEGGESYFVVFSDETTSVSTYGGGRFLYPAKPCDTCAQVTVLDFNMAQNPPCAFTDFATCPLPPTQNQLKFKVSAGEKTYEDH